ncbi:MAG: DNA gyrase subunit B, partial [OM182 bacterium]
PGIAEDALESLVKSYNDAYAIISRLARLYPTEVLEAMIFSPTLAVEDLQSEASANTWLDLVRSKLAELHAGASANLTLVIKHDTERNVYLPEVRLSLHGLERSYSFSLDFFKSGEYRALAGLGATLDGLIEEGAYAKRGEKTHPIKNFAEAIEWLTQDAMKGHYLQRYKGLGEMNPDQLWDTTMNPETRRMLQVTIDDAINADQLFNTLMGDQVDPRREFIEQNAMAAENLDI